MNRTKGINTSDEESNRRAQRIYGAVQTALYELVAENPNADSPEQNSIFEKVLGDLQRDYPKLTIDEAKSDYVRYGETISKYKPSIKQRLLKRASLRERRKLNQMKHGWEMRLLKAENKAIFRSIPIPKIVAAFPEGRGLSSLLSVPALGKVLVSLILHWRFYLKRKQSSRQLRRILKNSISV